MAFHPLARSSALAPFLRLGRPAPRAAAEDTKAGPSAEETVAGDDTTAEDTMAGSDTMQGEDSMAAEGEDTIPAAEGDDTVPAAEDEDEEDREEMRGDTATARARTRERARIAHILTHAAAQGRSALAMQLAFGTRLGRHEAVAALAAAPAQAPAAPAAATPSLDAAMAAFAGKAPGPDAGAGNPVAGGLRHVASWEDAAKRAGVWRGPG